MKIHESLSLFGLLLLIACGTSEPVEPTKESFEDYENDAHAIVDDFQTCQGEKLRANEC